MSDYDLDSEEGRTKFYKSVEWRGKQGIRNKALERDNYECVKCKEQGKVTTREDEVLEVDHIYELKDYPKLALWLDNLQTLCRPCHNKKHDRLGNINKKIKWDDEMW